MNLNFEIPKTTITPRLYLNKADEFAGHWVASNTALGAPPIILPGNYVQATMATDRTALAALVTAAITAANNLGTSAAARDALRIPLAERIRQFNALVRGVFPGSGMVRDLPKVPALSAGDGIWMQAMADMDNIWGTINAITPTPLGVTLPMVLPGGYTKANFNTDQTALNAAFTACINNTRALKEAYRARNVAQLALETRYRQYRLQVQGRFAKGSVQLATLPALVVAGGHTPDAVNASAVWSVPLAKAVITYSASADPDLQEYELRGSIGGTKFDNDTATVFDTHAAGDLTPFETDTGLGVSGAKVFYKVVVVLTTGREKGSKAVSVTRP